MPALQLDVALVHLNRADAQGNAAYLGLDPYFDDLFLMAAERACRLVRAGGGHRRAVEGGAAAGAADQPDDGRRRRRGAQRRALHHLPPGLRRDEKFQRQYADGAGSDAEAWAGVRRPPTCPAARPTTRRRCASSRRSVVISVTRAEVCVVACADCSRDAGEILVSPMTTVASIGRAAGPADLLPRHPAHRRRGSTAGGHPGARRAGRGRGLDAVRRGSSRRWVGPAPRDDGRQPDRPLRQPEHVCVRPLQHPTAQMFGVRGAPGNTINHATSYWVGNHSTGCSATRRRGVRHRLRQGRSRQSGVPVRQRAPGGVQPRRLRLQRPGPPDAAVSLHPGVDRRRGARGHLVRGARPGRGGYDAAGHLRRAEADPRGDRSEGAAGQGGPGDESARR